MRSDWLRRLIPIPIRPSLRDYVLGNYFQKWVILGSLIGLVAGAGAIVFYESIRIASTFFLVDLAGYHQPLASGEGATVVSDAARPWALPLILTLGGLLSGLIVYTLAPEAEGHGTDVAIGAFHRRAGHIRARIPAVKLVASAITIGSGGSAGREGPTAEIAAGFGSWLGDAFHLSDTDRRIALAVGIGAGIGAIFKAPLGGAILSAEILYIRDFEIEALVPGFIASVIGYCVFAAWAGWQPVFGGGTDLSFHQPEELTWYFVLGLLCGVAGILYARSFYATRDFFRSVRIPNHVKPAIGGLAVGLIALLYPQILAMGYGWLQIAIDGNVADLTLKTMLALLFVKMIATALTVGSGGSGGVFAPGLFIGGMLGGGLWGLLHTHVGWMPDSPAPYVIVGMMALFGGVAKAPIAVILMVAEMTNEFSLVIPAMLATTLAYLVTGDTRIYENQVNRRADSPAHSGENAVPLLRFLTVADAMRVDVAVMHPETSLADALTLLSQSGNLGFPVVENDDLVGIFTTRDALIAEQRGLVTVGSAMTRDLKVAHPADNLKDALLRMTSAGISRLPVVDPQRPQHLLGVVSVRDIATALEKEPLAVSRARGTATTPQR